MKKKKHRALGWAIKIRDPWDNFVWFYAINTDCVCVFDTREIARERAMLHKSKNPAHFVTAVKVKIEEVG